MRWAAYAGVSATLAVGVVVKALSERPNFYSAAVYLAQSSANLMILTNFSFLCACVLLLGLQKLLYGPLRPIEIEQLYERAWLFVTETCLSMTIFRGSFGAWFMVMFFSLLAGKVWGWIGEGRVEILEQQPPANPRLFHARLSTSLCLSVLFATYMLNFSVRTVLAQAKPDMMVMFGFEFAILTILAVSTAARYAICLAEINIVRKQKTARLDELRAERAAAIETNSNDRQDAAPGSSDDVAANIAIDYAEVEVEGWEGKGRWIFYLDLVTDFLKLTVYVTFFSVLLGFYGLPLHIMRDLFLSFRSFFKRVSDFIRYRNATRDMNERYPNATAEEIDRENICIICREEMRPIGPTDEATPAPQRTNPGTERMRPKKLPCGHILHFSCLRSWLERQQNCPTCRRPVVVSQRQQGPGANAAGLQGNVQGQHGGPALAGQGGRGAAQNRARIINFGRLRIGFGAGGGNLIEDLAQRIHEGEQRARPPPEANGAGVQQHFGFGFGFGRRQNNANNNSTATSSLPVQAQLDQIERTLQQQINTLRVSSSQLHVVRLLQNELLRLRNLQGNDGSNGSNGSNEGTTAPPVFHPTPGPVGPSGPFIQGVMPQPTTMLSSHQQPVLASDSNALPEGMTLPPGWTVLPLQRSDGLPSNATSHSHNTNNGTTEETRPRSSEPATALPRHPTPDSAEPPAATVPDGIQPSTGVGSTTSVSGGPGLPSWGFGSTGAKNEGSAQAEALAPSPVENGADASDGREGKGDKGKAKATTVENVDEDADADG